LQLRVVKGFKRAPDVNQDQIAFMAELREDRAAAFGVLFHFAEYGGRFLGGFVAGFGRKLVPSGPTNAKHLVQGA